MVAALNKRAATKDDLDEASYVAMGWITGDGGLERLKEAMQQKFGDRAQPKLLPEPGSLPPGLPAAYAYLLKALPFRWAFARLDYALEFAGQKVEAFGIHQYLPGDQPDEDRMAEQVLIYSFRTNDDFIIELETESEGDRLLLAKVLPEETLGQTVDAVRERMAGWRPTRMEEMEDLVIPVVDFDLTRDYDELLSAGLVLAQQRTRFRLDETGAVLESEGVGVMGFTPRNFVFDRPFLILLERDGAGAPYSALWVGNAELLVRSQREHVRRRRDRPGG
jgi:hypothetical protein